MNTKHLLDQETSTVASRLPYEPPLLDVYQYAVEHGFAQSPDAVTLENFREINDDGSTTDGSGENYHGEWF